MDKPIFLVSAINIGKLALSSPSDEAGGLLNALYLSEGARVILTRNLWTAKGLTNGSMGTVVGLLYGSEENFKSNVPTTVLVQFDNYIGPSFLSHIERVVPIEPVTARWTKKSSSCSRTQVPLQLAFAITIHKSQGLTLDRVLIDIGKRG